jgi:hypothetical protein
MIKRLGVGGVRPGVLGCPVSALACQEGFILFVRCGEG